MATVTVAANVTDPACASRAKAAASAWQNVLTARGSKGTFEIAHGKHLSCAEAHDHGHNRGLWIHVKPIDARCPVFVSRRGARNWFAGHTRHNDPTVWVGACTCGRGH